MRRIERSPRRFGAGHNEKFVTKREMDKEDEDWERFLHTPEMLRYIKRMEKKVDANYRAGKCLPLDPDKMD